MSAEHAGKTRLKVHVSAPAGVVYGLIADAMKWPLYFSPNIHVEQQKLGSERDWLRLWSLKDGQLKSWISWRQMDAVERCVEFRQKPPASPSDQLRGTLTVRPEGPHSSELELLHDFHDAGTLPGDVLADVKDFAERWTRLDDLVLSFEDSMRVNGPPELLYDFLYRAWDWPELVPHVARVDLTEDAPGVQRMTMETVTEYGMHTMNSVRICFPHAGRIIYKLTATPSLLEAHTGEWSVIPDETGVTVLAQQNVVLREENVAAVLGAHADLADARRYAREALGWHCRALLAQAEKHARSAVRML